MKKVIGVRFRSVDKVCYFDIDNFSESCFVGSEIICKTNHGVELGTVCVASRLVDDDDVEILYDSILRVANHDDIKRYEENLKLEKNAIFIAEQCIRKHKLSMNLVSAIYIFDRSKIIFFFTAGERVDFRALVKDLAAIFHVRIELRQIKIRDEAKMLGGIGICGRPFCCKTFLNCFHPVSIKMAKEQNLSLNPKKISGCCGRLMCCLQYEYDAYKSLNKTSPKIGMKVISPDGEGTIVDGNPITGKYRVKLMDSDEIVLKFFHKSELQFEQKVTNCDNSDNNMSLNDE